MRTLELRQKAWAVAAPVALILASALPLATAAAQDPSDDFIRTGSYAVSIPLGDTRRYVPVPSWMGVTWEGLWPVRKRTWGGLELGLHDFFDQSSGTTNFPQGAATGFQIRDLLVMTAMAEGRWFAINSEPRGLYFGFGAGGEYVSQYYQLGPITPFNRTGFHITAAPEAGYVQPIMTDIDAVVSVRFATPVSAGSYLGGGGRSFRFLTIGFGLAER